MTFHQESVLSSDRDADERPLQGEAVVALLFVAAIAIRFKLPSDIPASFLYGLAILPVAGRYLLRYRWAIAMTVLAVCAAGAGLFLASTSLRGMSSSLMVGQSTRVAGIGVVLAVFLWARSIAGTRRTIFAFAVGSIANIAVVGTNDNNLWKFSFSVPLILLLLSIPGVYKRRLPQALLGLVLVVVSLLFDSRSTAGFLLVAVALTLTQRSQRAGGVPAGTRRTWFTALRLVAVVLGAFFMVQGAILEGMLGDEIRIRTEAQIGMSGSLIAGGRPEMGASVALIAQNPWGFGLGVLATPTDVILAKTGMAALGYDPNNGYVENYMFGRGLEVHSVLGDLWILCGVLGAAVAIFAALWLVQGMVRGLAAGTISTVAAYLAIRSLWDFAFSPLPTAIILLPLALAVVAQRKTAPPNRTSTGDR